MEIIKSNKGKDKVCFEGYMYVLHVECKNFIRWRCNKASSLKCKGILKTSLQKTEPAVAVIHNHPRDSEEVRATKCYTLLKERAATSTTKPAEVFAEAVAELDVEAKSRMPLEDSAKRTIRNQRSKHRPADIHVLHELVIQDEWCTTGRPDFSRFLLRDNGIEAEERIIIFATDESLRHLASARSWYMDGNFALAPRLFQQLYVIRVPVGTIFITTVYCLLQNKTQSTYETMLSVILEECATRDLYPDPTTIHMDFEKATIQAAKAVLGDEVEIRGCFYHLTQSTHRKIQSLGLEMVYRQDEEFSLFSRMLDGLAFLPLQDVPAGMEYLRSVVPGAATELLQYFDTTYVTGTFRRIGNPQQGQALRLRNVPAPYPPAVWNVHLATLADEDRTNNHSEGWNHRFSNLVGQNHPTVWKLIEKMRLEVGADQTKLAQRAVGVVQNKTKRTQFANMQNILKTLCREYDEGTRPIPEFLRAVAHTIRYN